MFRRFNRFIDRLTEFQFRALIAGLLIFALCIAFTPLVHAAILHASWTNATKNTDGTPIPTTGDGRIISTDIEYGKCNATKDGIVSVAGNIAVTGTVTTADTPDLPPGDWCAHAAHINSYNVSSDWSNIAVKTIPAPKPEKPTNFSW